MARLTPAVTTRLKDEAAEQVRRNHEQRISELAGSPLAGAVVLEIELPNGTDVTVAHRLGRRPRGVWVAAVRGAVTAGQVIEVSGTDPDRIVVLRATGYGATVTAAVLVL